MNGPPAPIGDVVPEKLIQWISEQESLTTAERVAAISLVSARNEFGRKKYGQSLMTQDGRITVVDALEELGDLLQYVFKGKLNQEDLSEVKALLPVLIELLK